MAKRQRKLAEKLAAGVAASWHGVSFSLACGYG